MLGEVLANFELIRAKPAELDERGCKSRPFSRVLFVRDASAIPVT
jgi:hypothetical protein